MAPFIENVSMAHVMSGYHYDAGPNSMLIQIVDPGHSFPQPKHNFKEVHRFEFFDAEEGPLTPKEGLISDSQAEEIVFLLKKALDNQMNVIVHCHAGVCRSGAVAEIGELMGFAPSGNFRAPNILVKKKMLQVIMDNDIL